MDLHDGDEIAYRLEAKKSCGMKWPHYLYGANLRLLGAESGKSAEIRPENACLIRDNYAAIG
jgi:hypothetical protein